jgi:hypothetical protein
LLDLDPPPKAPFPRTGSVQLGLFMLAATFLIGADRDHIAQSPAAERGVVIWSALALFAAFVFGGASWFVALSIARGGNHPEHYAIAALFGFIILCVDRAMIRSHWLAYGEQVAKLRRFSVLEAASPKRIGGDLLRWMFRVVVTVALTFTSAAFLELELFRNDATATMLAENTRQNQQVFEKAEKRSDADIESVAAEIQELDGKAAGLIAAATRSAAGKQAASLAEVTLLQAEKEALMRQATQLAKAIACAKQDQIAEKYAGIRCDGRIATVAKEGAKFKAASEQLDYLQVEQTSITTRSREIDTRLAKLGSQSSLSPVEVQPELTALAAQRAGLQAQLSALAAGRDDRMQRYALADPNYVPLSDGLIIRGDALDRMASASPWLATRVWSVWLALMLLDLSAMLVTVMVTPPLVYCLRQFAALEVAAHRIIAASETDLSDAHLTALKARQKRFDAEVDEARHDHLRHTRSLYLKQVDRRLSEDLASA